MSRRSGRRGERGNAVVVVAVGAVALISVTGLAVDGGMAAGAYRHAQNAADAGALAAARQEYLNATATPAVASTATSLTPYAQNEVTHNGAQLVSVTGASGISGYPGPQTLWAPTSSGGISAQAALADVSTQATVGGITVDAHLNVNNAQSNTKAKPTASGGSSSSSMVYMDQGDSHALNQSGYSNCWSSQATYTSGQNTTGTPTACPLGTFPTFITTVGTLATTANPDAEVLSTNVSTAAPSMELVSESKSVGKVGVNATTVQTDNNLYFDLINGVTARAATYATGVQVASAGTLTVSASVLQMSLRISFPSTASHPDIVPQCTPTTISVTTVTPAETDTLPVDQTCTITNIPDLHGLATITPSAWSPGITSTQDCSNTNGTWNCVIQGCEMKIQIPTSPIPTVICLLQFNFNFSVQPSNGLFTQFLGGVAVTATVPQPTYFMRVLGWTQTSPSATGIGGIESVIDESSSAFAVSPFGIPNSATQMGGAPPCVSGTYGALQPGCQYYLYGPSMQTNSPSAAMGPAWQGQLASDSGHRVGTGVKPATTTTATPQPYTSTSAYYLEPVFDPVSQQILYYAVFLPVAGQPHYGLLVNSIPKKGPLVQATSVIGWTVVNQGAVSIKLEQ